jgi:hypothetical protein
MKRTGFVSLHRMKGESGGHPRANDNARNNNVRKLSNVCCGHHLDGWPAGTPPSVVPGGASYTRTGEIATSN